MRLDHALDRIAFYHDLMTADEFRKLALEIPGAIEQSHMEHPDFRLYGKIFASLGAPDENWGMVKLTPAQQSRFLKRAPEMFKLCNGAWGRRGCTNVQLEAAKKTVLKSAIAVAAGNMQAHAPKRKTTK
jgi:hypothetical protein